MLKRFIAIVAVLAGVLAFSTPAEASYRYQRSALVETDTIDTRVTATVYRADEGYRSQVACINVWTENAGYSRTINIELWQSGRKVANPISNYKQSRGQTRICVQAKQFSIGYMNNRPFLRVFVEEDVWGPWNPRGRATIPLY